MCAAPERAGPCWSRVRPRVPRGGDLVWCDACTIAAGSCARVGSTVVTGEYDEPGIGPRVGMADDLADR